MLNGQVTDLQISPINGGWGGDLSQRADMSGYSPTRGRFNRNPNYERRVQESARLLRDVLDGRTDPRFMQEALNPTHPVFVTWLQENYPGLFPANFMTLRETMSVTDYQALFTDVLDRLYYGYYQGFPVVNKSVARIHQCRDFRIVSRYLLDGLVSPFAFIDAAAPPAMQNLSGPVPQDGSTFPTTNTAPLQYQPALAQAMASVNWRAAVNDDLGIFRDIPKRLAMVANRGITIFINTLFTAFGGYPKGVLTPGAGFNTSLYNSGYGNIINTANGASSTNPALSAQGLMDGFKILAGMKDSSGQPIMMMGRMKVVYGPSNYAVAKNLQNMLSNHVSVEGGNQAGSTGFPSQWIETNGWVAENIDWIMDPYIQNPYNTDPGSWFIFMDPGVLDRPAIEVGFLQGFETPQLFQKLPNTMRVGGGVEPQMGDFISMDSDMKIVSVFGGTQIDGRSTVASNGTGS